MMVALRLVFGLLLLAGAGCFVGYLFTGDVRWRRRGLKFVKWAVGMALVFFAVLIVSRLVDGY